MKALGESKLLQFCGTSMQSVFGSIQSFVVSMNHGRPPNLGAVSDSPFLLKVKEALGRFCIQEVSGGSDGSGGVVLFGSAAVTKMLEDLKAKSERWLTCARCRSSLGC